MKLSITDLVTAIVAIIVAVGGYLHSRQTRQQLNQQPPPADTGPNSRSTPPG